MIADFFFFEGEGMDVHLIKSLVPQEIVMVLVVQMGKLRLKETD